jgi:hypothetical protein
VTSVIVLTLHDFNEKFVLFIWCSVCSSPFCVDTAKTESESFVHGSLPPARSWFVVPLFLEPKLIEDCPIMSCIFRCATDICPMQQV